MGPSLSMLSFHLLNGSQNRLENENDQGRGIDFQTERERLEELSP